MIKEKASGFIYRNARPVDLARWRYHFENGNKEAVLRALSFYQNKDGGFGHALEADLWNPNSTPIQTWAATEILREIDFIDKEHKSIKGILNYLRSGQNFKEGFWSSVVKSNNDYPHAPWWHAETDSTLPDDYNPTACLAGFIMRFADKNDELYRMGCRIVKEAVNRFMYADRQNDMHTIHCYIRLMQYCEEADINGVIDLSALKNKLIEQVNLLITRNTSEWDTSYICKPSQFFNSNSSIFYVGNEDIANYECDYIINTQLADGSWNIPWQWNDYPQEWAVSKNWWKAYGIIINMLYLRGFGKL